MSPSCDRCARTAALIAALVGLALVLPSRSLAKTPAHCRDIDFTGAAGAGSQDKVTLRVVGKDGTELDKSCLIQVQPSETAIHFAERVVREWGDGTGTICPGVPIPTPTPPIKPTLKKCTAGINGHSCKKEWVFKTKSDGSIKKKHLRVCCFEESDCSGPKYGKVSAGKIPHTLQSKIDPDIVFEPPPTSGVTARAAAIDPISVVQKPAGGAQGCRSALGKGVASYVGSAAAFLGKCSRAEVESPGSCAPAELAAALNKLASALAPVPQDKCPAQGDPSDFGFAPCIPGGTNTCSAGMVGGTCQNDAGCDTTPGAGDGVCGDWSQVGSCLVTLLQTPLELAFDEVWGGVVPPLMPGPDRCVVALSDALATLVVTNVAETVACQKKVDGGSLALPEGTPFCRDADLKGVRAAVAAKALAQIGARCQDPDVVQIAPCTPDATTVAGAQACIGALADATHRALVDAVFTEGRAPVCGDGNRTGDEPCDPTAPLPHEQVCRNAAPGLDTCGPSCTCACPSAVDVVLDATDPVSRLDRGWTGVDHGERLVGEMRTTLAVTGCASPVRPCGACTLAGPIPNVEGGGGAIQNRRCSTDTSLACTVDPDCGVGTCEYFLGPPFPVSAGGVSLCYLHRLSGPLTGTATPEEGSIGISLNASIVPYLGIGVAQGCPVCAGDLSANDGVPAGTCNGGARNGLPCDANGTSGTLAFGTTSLDCPPNPGAALGAQPLHLALATAPAIVPTTPASPGCTAVGFTGERCACDTCDDAAAIPCASDADCAGGGATCGGLRCLGGVNDGLPCLLPADCPGGSCARPGEPTRPNPCSDSACTPSAGDGGVCSSGPLEQVCQIESFRGCIVPGDCPAPGDTCIVRNRRCFPDPITATGAMSAPIFDVATPTLGGVACVAPTTSAGINAGIGLPGPMRVLARTTMRNLP